MTAEQQALFDGNFKLIFYAVRKYAKIQSYRKEDREDIIQEATISFARACVLWDKSKTKFTTYAMRSMRNRIWQAVGNMNLRGFTPRRTADKRGSTIIASVEAMRESVLFDIAFRCDTREGRFDRDQLMLAMKYVFSPDREIIIAHYLDSTPRQVIANKMGISRQMVTQYLRRGLKRLRDVLEKLDNGASKKN